MLAEAEQRHSSPVLTNGLLGNVDSRSHARPATRDGGHTPGKPGLAVPRKAGLDVLCSALHGLTLDSSLDRDEVLHLLEAKWKVQSGSAAAFYLSFTPTLAGLGVVRLLHSGLNVSRRILRS